MQTSQLLDLFHQQLAERDRLCPLRDFSAWLQATSRAAQTAAQAGRALAPHGSELPVAVVQALCNARTAEDGPSGEQIAACKAAFSKVRGELLARCDFQLL